MDTELSKIQSKLRDRDKLRRERAQVSLLAIEHRHKDLLSYHQYILKNGDDFEKTEFPTRQLDFLKECFSFDFRKKVPNEWIDDLSTVNSTWFSDQTLEGLRNTFLRPNHSQTELESDPYRPITISVKNAVFYHQIWFDYIRGGLPHEVNDYNCYDSLDKYLGQLDRGIINPFIEAFALYRYKKSLLQGNLNELIDWKQYLKNGIDPTVLLEESRSQILWLIQNRARVKTFIGYLIIYIDHHYFTNMDHAYQRRLSFVSALKIPTGNIPGQNILKRRLDAATWSDTLEKIMEVRCMQLDQKILT